MRAARRSRAAWLRCRAPPVDRQHPVAPSRNPAPASTRPVDGPVRPGSSCIGAQTGLRAAIDPTAHPESAARRAPVARSVRLRSVRSALQPPVGPPISARSGAIRPSTRPGRSMSLPRRPAGSRSSCPAAACADRVRDPRHPHPGPPLSSRRGQGRAHTHMPARAAWKFPERKSERGDCPLQRGLDSLVSGQEQAEGSFLRFYQRSTPPPLRYPTSEKQKN